MYNGPHLNAPWSPMICARSISAWLEWMPFEFRSQPLSWLLKRFVPGVVGPPGGASASLRRPPGGGGTEPGQGHRPSPQVPCSLCSCGSRGMASSRQTGKQNNSASIRTIGGSGTRMKYMHRTCVYTYCIIVKLGEYPAATKGN